MTAIGRTFVAILSTDMRGPVVKRKAETREAAYAMARTLLDRAEEMVWHGGEVVRVEVGQAEG